MEANEILILRTLGYGLAETSEKSDGASMSVSTARELGRLILGMISDNHRMADVGLLYRQMRNDFALLEGRADKVSLRCSELIQERNSLKILHEQETKSLSGLLVEVQKERDALRRELEKADESGPSSRASVELCQERDSLKEEKETYRSGAWRFKEERDSCIREIEGMRKALAVGDAAVIELRKVKEERDSLREQLQKPLVQFAVELERMNNEAAQAMEKALEAKKTIGAIA